MSFKVELARARHRMELKVKSTLKGSSRDTWTKLSHFETPSPKFGTLTATC
jgi:hypothetical protein